MSALKYGKVVLANFKLYLFAITIIILVANIFIHILHTVNRIASATSSPRKNFILRIEVRSKTGQAIQGSLK